MHSYKQLIDSLTALLLCKHPLRVSELMCVCSVGQSEPETLRGWPTAGGAGDGGPAAAAQPIAAAAPH